MNDFFGNTPEISFTPAATFCYQLNSDAHIQYLSAALLC